MILTEEQRAAVDCDGDLMLTACPGSGKTRVIISKLARVIEEVRDTPRRVACITYTNSAVHEIEARLRQQTQLDAELYYDVCTIHSFCLNHIFRPYCHLIEGFENGFRVLTPDSDEFRQYVNSACEQFGRFDLSFQDYEEFTQLRMNIEGHPVGNAVERGAISVELANEYWRRIRRAGYVDFANIIYHSFCLLRHRPEISTYMQAKFAWILVDEFQDTTDLQVEILTLIADGDRTRFFLVGDPNQSIYRFAGARPDLANEFADSIHARTDLQLSGNFRSSTHIVSHANMLFPRNPDMAAVGPSRDFPAAPQYQIGRSPFEVITEQFLPALEELEISMGDAAVLAPTWFALFPLGQRLREFGVSIVGPGARPYRRSRMFASLAEQICAYLLDPNPSKIVGIERALFTMLLDATGQANFKVFSYEGRKLVFQLVAHARELYDDFVGGVAWLEGAANTFGNVLIEAGLLNKSEHDLLVLSVEQMKNDMANSRVDLENLGIEDLGIFANPDTALKLSTLHFAKGREYKAVALIDLHEGRIPHFASRTVEDFQEAKRQFYVGVTRAEQFLMYVTDTTDYRNQPSRFLRAREGVGVC